MRNGPLVVAAVGLLELALVAPSLGQATLHLEADPPGGCVERGQTIEWRLHVEVDPQESRGLAGLSADLVTDLTARAPGFEFDRAVNTSNFPQSDVQLDLGPHFVNLANLGTPILKEGLATLQTIGGTQDTLDTLASTLDVGGQTFTVLRGVVIEGVGQSGSTLAAHGSFTIPTDATTGPFRLWTGGVPGNPGQTKVNLLAEITEVTRGGTDARWRVIGVSPVDQQGSFDFTIDDCPDEPPALVHVMDGLGPTPAAFISPLGETVPFDTAGLQLSADVELLVPVPGLTLTSNGDGDHTLTLDTAVPAGDCVTLTFVVADLATRAVGTIVVTLCHLPLDVNQDGQVNIQDITAWGAEFNGERRARPLTDTNGDGVINVQDATRVGDTWFGRPPATRAWNGAALP